MMAQIIGTEPDSTSAPPRAGEIIHSRASIKAAADLLGYQPLVKLQEGLEDTLEYYKGLRD